LLCRGKDFTVKWLLVQEIAPSPVAPRQEVHGVLSPEQKRELVQRVVNSEELRRSPALRAFLLYITERVNSGRAEELKEQSIGAEVLGRKPNYDPADDNIVRVRAHELRGRLARYFASEGIQEPVVITIPKGGYAPEFVHREAFLLDSSENAPKAPEGSYGARINHWRFWSLATVLTLLLATSSYLLITTAFKNRSQSTTLKPSGALPELWMQFFAKPNGILTIIYSDSGIALWQRLNNKDLSLGEYLSRKYLDGHDNELLEIVSQRTSSPADLNTSLRIQGVAAELGGEVSAQFARNVNAELLQHRNLVLIGSRRSNPWVEIYEPSMNFQLRIDPKTQSPAFFNRSPQPSEFRTYGIPDLRETSKTANGQFIKEAEEKEFESYGVVALLKGCGSNQAVLLLEGLNMQATQAAGDLVTDPQQLDMLLRSIGHKAGTSVAPFEALFQVTSLPGGYDNPKVIAYRIRPPAACAGG
jgi:hypothetical protein